MWLRLHVISQVREFAHGIRVDTDALEELASRFDPSQPDELRGALESGALLPQRSEEQTAALTRLENLLATIEGWVDVVTEDATSRLPSAARIAEAVRRRRAVGGPAEQALGSLVGLELRPRRMREAAAMWRAVTEAVGVAGRDALWDLPRPHAVGGRHRRPRRTHRSPDGCLAGEATPADAMDDALAQLIAEETAGLADGFGGGDDEPGDAGRERRRRPHAGRPAAGLSPPPQGTFFRSALGQPQRGPRGPPSSGHAPTRSLRSPALAPRRHRAVRRPGPRPPDPPIPVDGCRADGARGRTSRLALRAVVRLHGGTDRDAEDLLAAVSPALARRRRTAPLVVQVADDLPARTVRAVLAAFPARTPRIDWAGPATHPVPDGARVVLLGRPSCGPASRG